VKIVQLAGPFNGPAGNSGKPAAVSAADFTYEVFVNYTVTFTNQSKNANSCRWHFGDGVILDTAGITVVHKYTAPGVHNPKLIATGPGGTDTLSATITF
jgi:PKD repeat protein